MKEIEGAKPPKLVEEVNPLNTLKPMRKYIIAFVILVCGLIAGTVLLGAFLERQFPDTLLHKNEVLGDKITKLIESRPADYEAMSKLQSIYFKEQSGARGGRLFDLQADSLSGESISATGNIERDALWPSLWFVKRDSTHSSWVVYTDMAEYRFDPDAYDVAARFNYMYKALTKKQGMESAPEKWAREKLQLTTHGK